MAQPYIIMDMLSNPPYALTIEMFLAAGMALDDDAGKGEYNTNSALYTTFDNMMYELRHRGIDPWEWIEGSVSEEMRNTRFIQRLSNQFPPANMDNENDKDYEDSEDSGDSGDSEDSEENEHNEYDEDIEDELTDLMMDIQVNPTEFNWDPNALKFTVADFVKTCVSVSFLPEVPTTLQTDQACCPFFAMLGHLVKKKISISEFLSGNISKEKEDYPVIVFLLNHPNPKTIVTEAIKKFWPDWYLHSPQLFLEFTLTEFHNAVYDMHDEKMNGGTGEGIANVEAMNLYRQS
ncbi:hypothetical protein P153DRAFT_433906 [Dothidotthia symphoricarpi CBS 119687]|uniref:Uncharacterized protein n=1 Tax=Dothidotthia symphoricarpi CBS 119687 TaxID=1392245 RepID=A0A6A6A2M8_9PLEO|nr:uncharacterized protein P153DRAFT_433906 [Dothidotthia symphoricarpi CBS 119687]KAF2126109.1 hypothetical protein P153DRAFT_433906 [Dothidotthia symphoricarpi CBS 119687]